MTEKETSQGDISTFGYPQWVTITIHNRTSGNIKIKNLVLSWGKLYEGDKNNEVPVGSYEGRVITSGGQVQLGSCGRESSPSGTEGRFDLYDENSNAQIRNFYWSCPWGSSTNTWTISKENLDYIVESWGANPDGGALGNITVRVFNVPK